MHTIMRSTYIPTRARRALAMRKTNLDRLLARRPDGKIGPDLFRAAMLATSSLSCRSTSMMNRNGARRSRR
jgi:hypothetical protein